VTSGAALIVAIDGPSGVGKTTVARGVAARLGVPYLETGAMYRALGWMVRRRGVDPGNRARVESLARGLDLDFEVAGGRVVILLDGTPVGDEIRTPEVSEATSRVAVYPGVRRRMVELQRRWAARCGGVLEGRDIGTQVFPDTPHKFYLDAPAPVRIERRLRQLESSGHGRLTRDELSAEVTARDRRDSERETSPLSHDASYTVIDTSRHSADEVIERIVAAVGGAADSDRAP